MTVGAVVVSSDLPRIVKVRDSKVLTIEEREALYPRIIRWALAYAWATPAPPSATAWA